MNDEQVRKKNLWAMKERLPEPNLNNFRLVPCVNQTSERGELCKDILDVLLTIHLE